MPDFTTHLLFGQQVRKIVPDNVAEVIDAQQGAFYWGLQGSDPLMYRLLTPKKSPITGYARTIHSSEIPEQFALMLEECQYQYGRVDGEILSAYMLGYLCHYMLDSSAHPYVYFLQDKITSLYPKIHRSGAHVRIESDIDVAMYEKIESAPISDFPINDYMTTVPMVLSVIAKLYQSILYNVYAYDVDFAEIEKSFLNNAFFLRKFYRGESPLKYFADGLDDITGRAGYFSGHFRRAQVNYDVLNENHGRWYHPYYPNEVRTDSFPDIFNDASKRAAQMLTAFCDALPQGPLPDFDYSVNFVDGKPS